jgi:hypothetical protein
MGINMDHPDRWKGDIIQSVDFYNKWFMDFAPKAYRETRLSTAIRVEQTLIASSNLREVSPELLRNHPEVLSILRMSTCPPIARDRLSGLANVPKSFIESMEEISNPRIPSRASEDIIESRLLRICNIIDIMRDQDIFIWLNDSLPANDIDITRAATVVADRLCNHISDPIIRNAQEKRQLNSIGSWLQSNNYIITEGVQFNEMAPG